MSAGLSVLLALGFALLATPLVLVDTWVQASYGPDIRAGETSPITVRIPQFAGFGAEGADDRLSGGQVVVARGQMVDAETEEVVQRIRDERPAGSLTFLAYFAGLFLLALLYSQHLRASHRGRLVRTQLVTLGLLLVVAIGVQIALIFTPMSVLIVPVAGIAIIAALAVDVSVGLATGLAVSMLMAFLVPFDAGTVAVLAIQAFASVLAISNVKNKGSRIVLAGVFGGAAAATAYVVFYFLATHASPFDELADPIRSAWIASFAGGVLSGILAAFAQPLYQYMLGEITKNRLVELEDLSNPLLKQIATNSPGTWQHSLAMANMAEIAANAIGGNGRLVRVGAYYHDLGKSLQPTYFIENLRAGEQSPHDRLPPDVSCDAIFAHVTEGVRVGRKEGLPERIIDFMHMHHGDGLLEYFWTKCQEQGNPKNLTEDDFRYPGIKPQTRETAILAIVDAVEAASRTLKNPDEYAIRTLVQRLVYGKLHLGQLDQSGLTVADLRKISNSLEETIKHAFHGRIEYPWQKKEREQSQAEDSTTQRERPRAPSEMAAQASGKPRPKRLSATQRVMDEPRLDSLDAPRPYWGNRRGPSAAEVAPTERVASDQMDAQPGDQHDTPPPQQHDTPPPQQRADTPAPVAHAPEARAETPQPVAQAAEVRAEPQQPAPAAQATQQPAPEPQPAPQPEPQPAPQPPAAESMAAPSSADDHETVLLLSKKKNDAAAPAAADDDAAERAPTNEVEPAQPTAPGSSEQLAVWNEALETATRPAEPPDVSVDDASVDGEPDSSDDAPTAVRRQPPPPPGSRARHGRGTIPLMSREPPVAGGSNGASADDGATPAEEETVAAATDPDEDKLSPGMMVLGPPPATQKKSKKG